MSIYNILFLYYNFYYIIFLLYNKILYYNCYFKQYLNKNVTYKICRIERNDTILSLGFSFFKYNTRLFTQDYDRIGNSEYKSTEVNLSWNLPYIPERFDFVRAVTILYNISSIQKVLSNIVQSFVNLYIRRSFRF